MSVLRPLIIRTLTMIGVFFVVMLMLVLTLGLTGYSDRILKAVVGEQLRAERTSLAETIRDPDQLEKVLADRQTEFEAFYGLDKPWWVRLPGMVLRVMTLDLGEARNLRSFEGSNSRGRYCAGAAAQYHALTHHLTLDHRDDWLNLWRLHGDPSRHLAGSFHVGLCGCLLCHSHLVDRDFADSVAFRALARVAFGRHVQYTATDCSG